MQMKIYQLVLAGGVASLLGSGVVHAAEVGDSTATFRLTGAAEVSYTRSADNPANNVIGYRAFDNREGTFSLANAVLDAEGRAGAARVRVALQTGLTGNTYYAAEPSHPAEGGAGESDARTWRLIQQAWVGWRSNDEAWGADAGIFLSPIGPEGVSVRDNWNWSRSNLFFALPSYHTGLRVRHQLSSTWALTGFAHNGWNSVIDNNDHLSVAAQLLQSSTSVDAALHYVGGSERNGHGPEGEPWRHLVDGWIQFRPGGSLAFMLHADLGFEDTDLGRDAWIGGAAYARWTVNDSWGLAARVDGIRESQDEGVRGVVSPLLFGAVDEDGRASAASLTGTLEYRPAATMLCRLEARHDRSETNLYFDGDATSGDGGVTLPNSNSQTTITLGVSAWFQ